MVHHDLRRTLTAPTAADSPREVAVGRNAYFG